jgi:hypothetical protein
VKTALLVMAMVLAAGGPVLVPNGDFSQADPKDRSKPLAWDKPDGLGVRWVEGAICLDTSISERDMVSQWEKTGLTQWNIPNPAPNAIAETYGLSYYSDPIPVRSGQVYKVSFDYKGPSGGAKLWVRGWGLYQGEKRRRYETIVNCRVKDPGWTRFEQEFAPTKHRPEVTEMRVMLYAYYPAGQYWFDNVRIEPVSDLRSP